MLRVDDGVAVRETLPQTPAPAERPAPVNTPADAADREAKIGAHQFAGTMLQFRVQATSVPASNEGNAGQAEAMWRGLPPGAERLVLTEIEMSETMKFYSDPAEEARKLAAEIERQNALHGPEAGGELVEKMYKENPREFTMMLRFVGDLPPAQQRIVADATGRAFDRMSPEDQQAFAKQIAHATVRDAFSPGARPTRLAELVAQSSSPEFKKAVVSEMMKVAETIKPKIFGDNGGVDVKALFNGAAIIAESAGGTLRAELFTNIVNTLPKVNLPSLTDDTQLKDRLSKLFIESGSTILHHNAPDGAYDAQFKDGMVKFFELTLFSENAGALRQDLMKSVITTMKDVGDAAKMPPASQSDYEKAHGGWSQQDHVEAMGGLAAFVAKAAENQKGAIQASQKAREETAKLFVGMAFAFVPGAKDVIGEVAVEGGDFLDKLVDKAINYAWDKSKSASESGVNQKLKALTEGDALKDIDQIMGLMREAMSAIHRSLPNDEQGELDLRVKFQAAFAYYHAL